MRLANYLPLGVSKFQPVTVVDGNWYLRPYKNAKSISLGSDKRQALLAVGAFYEAKRRRKESHEDAMMRHKARTWVQMSIRARGADRKCMSRDEFDALWARAGGYCEMTSIPFSFKKIENCIKRPWAPSVDRVDNSKGYEFANCRLVCTAVNLALNEFGDAVLRRIANGLR